MKRELTRLADELDVGDEGKGGIQNGSQASGFDNWVNSGTIDREGNG